MENCVTLAVLYKHNEIEPIVIYGCINIHISYC